MLFIITSQCFVDNNNHNNNKYNNNNPDSSAFGSAWEEMNFHIIF
jgi:hypothetical protein